MPFTVDDFPDLLRLLEQHPEWRAELRRQVLTDELLELPAVVQQLAERVDALTQQVDALTQRVDALTQQVDALTQQVDALTHQVAALAHLVDGLGQRMEALAEQISTMGGHVAWLRGEVMEIRYERHFGAYFGPLARRLRLLDSSRLADLLDDAVDQNQLTQGERDAVLQADLVLTGRRRADDAEVYLAVEVSVGIGLEDVQRASERARILERLGKPAIPVVAGNWINPEADEMARAVGVWRALNGRVAAPNGSA